MMKQIRFKLIAALSLVAVTTIIVTGLSQTLLSNKFINEAVERESKQLSQRFYDQIKADKLQVLSLAETVAAQPSVIQAFENGDRETLVKEFSAAFKVLKGKFGMGQFQFHLPPATSFLRLHKTQKFGDDLSSFRKTVVAVNTKKKNVSGVEVGRAGLGIRGVTPIFNGKKHLGSVEFGLSLKKKFIDQFAQSTGTQVAVFLTKSLEKGGSEIKLMASNIKLDLPPTELSLERVKTQTISIEHGLLDANQMKGIAFPIRDYSNEPVAIALVLLDISKLNAILNESLVFTLIQSMILLAAFGLLAFWMWKSVLMKLASMKTSMLALAQGDKDIDLSDANREDEIGEMARSVKVFRDNAIEREQLEEKSKAEQEQKLKRHQKVEELISNFQTEAEQTLQAVGVNAKEMENSAQSLTQTAIATSDQAGKASDAATYATQNVQAVAAATEELTASVREISSQVTQTSTIITEATNAALSTDEKVANLSQAASKIGDVIALIQDIAEQTNLLALNATIEAARAGEAGRGFAIVASEVKDLASQTAKATEEISTQINDIQTETVDAVKAIQAIAEKMNDVNANAGAIASAVEEQSAATSEIANNINAAATGTQEAEDNVSSVSESIKETSSSAENVLNASRSVNHKAENMQQVVTDFLTKVAAV